MDTKNGRIPQNESENLRIHHRQAAREQLTGVPINKGWEVAVSIQVPAAAYSELRDEVELSDFSEVLKDQAYEETNGGLELEGFFRNNEEIYQVLTKDYLEYSVDLSINENTVHMCGHSEHIINAYPTFREISLSIFDTSKAFYKDLQQKVSKTIST